MKAIFVLVCILLLASCGQAGKTAAAQLNLYQQDGIEVRLGPDPVVVEQVLQLDVQVPAGYRVEKAQIVGVSMAMGLIPLRFEGKGLRYQSEFVLGACSDPQMQWQLQLFLVSAAGQPQRLDLPFYSSWPK